MEQGKEPFLFLNAEGRIELKGFEENPNHLEYSLINLLGVILSEGQLPLNGIPVNGLPSGLVVVHIRQKQQLVASSATIPQ